MLGWSAVTGAVDWTIVAPMFVGGVTWGMMYDIIYAHQVSASLRITASVVPESTWSLGCWLSI
jgi:4-hydroxybenzoate polyprenyltransferase